MSDPTPPATDAVVAYLRDDANFWICDTHAENRRHCHCHRDMPAVLARLDAAEAQASYEVAAVWRDRCLAAESRAAKAEAFKAWVHEWLDNEGVPADPEPEQNAASGCRVGGRMRWLKTRLATAEKDRDQLRADVARKSREDVPRWCHDLLTERGVPDDVGEGFPSLGDRVAGLLDERDRLRKAVEMLMDALPEDDVWCEGSKAASAWEAGRQALGQSS